ncbi:hypothetical protein DFR67_102127 [Williamsia limnetica]|uniref:Uncharacterized protein n=1 Tax=Williamsia limnetica TaxID=882452 RepID=A0A318RUA6_WILLI|nr:hypothetical protein [Williamsia limnetica]PYE19989.1 hypothetical protein DFR67_102127 [Williamsia limnetica]
MRKRYLSMLVAAMLLAFPVSAGAAPLIDLPDTGSLEQPGTPGSYVAPDPTSGTLIADSGFEVKRDGFSFANWGESDALHRRSMTPATMQSLYGDRICARIVDGACVLSATGEVLEQDSNESSNGGHCFGLAAVAGLFASGQLDKTGYVPAGQNLYDVGPSDRLDGLISRYFNTQYAVPTSDSPSRSSVASTLDQLEAAWQRGDHVVLGILGEIGGHGITPIALRDLGDGKTGIVVYDNNFPGVEKMMVADAASDTWYYTTALNPADKSYLFVGSPSNQMIIFPLSQMTRVHECPTCRDVGDDSVLLLVKDTAKNPDGSANDWTLGITTPDGRPVAGLEKLAHANTARSELYRVPAGAAFKLTIGGVPLGQTADMDISILGDGWINEVDDLELLPGASASVTVDDDQRALRLSSTYPLTPRLTVASEEADWSVAAKGTGLNLLPGSTVSVGRDTDGDYTFGLAGIGLPGSLHVDVKRSDTTADHIARTNGSVAIPVGTTGSVAAETWDGTTPLMFRVGSQNHPMTVG